MQKLMCTLTRSQFMSSPSHRQYKCKRFAHFASITSPLAKCLLHTPTLLSIHPSIHLSITPPCTSPWKPEQSDSAPYLPDWSSSSLPSAVPCCYLFYLSSLLFPSLVLWRMLAHNKVPNRLERTGQTGRRECIQSRRDKKNPKKKHCCCCCYCLPIGCWTVYHSFWSQAESSLINSACSSFEAVRHSSPPIVGFFSPFCYPEDREGLQERKCFVDCCHCAPKKVRRLGIDRNERSLAIIPPPPDRGGRRRAMIGVESPAASLSAEELKCQNQFITPSPVRWECHFTSVARQRLDCGDCQEEEEEPEGTRPLSR